MEKELVMQKGTGNNNRLQHGQGKYIYMYLPLTPLREFTNLLLRVLYLQDGRRLYIISKGQLRIYVPQVLHLR
jgi:hypothetical protein